MNLQLEPEANIIGEYLLGKKNPIKKSIGLYIKAIEVKQINLTKNENKIWVFMIKNKWSIGCIDSALAFFSPQSNIRKRLLVMLAILETMPEYTDLFLPRSRPLLYHLYILWVGCRAILKTMAGYLLLKFILRYNLPPAQV